MSAMQEPEDSGESKRMKFSALPKEPNRDGEPNHFRSLLNWVGRLARIAGRIRREIEPESEEERAASDAKARLDRLKAEHEILERAEKIRELRARQVQALGPVPPRVEAAEEAEAYKRKLELENGAVIELEAADPDDLGLTERSGEAEENA